MRVLQRPARAVLRRFPALRGRATQAVGQAVHVAPDFSISACTRSLERSLRSLNVDRLDLLLLHEATPADLADGSAVEWIQRQKERGVVRAIGVATTAHAAGSILAEHLGVFDVIQVPSSVLTPSLNLLAGTTVVPITHGVVAKPLARAHAKLAREPTWSEELSRLSGTDVRAPGELVRLLIAWALFENPRGVVLVGTSSEAHLRDAPEAVRAFDRSRLAMAGEFLRASLDG
jgi:aryl-alcohol dehydrogenase-like predicted oxidoreductase